MVPISPEHTKTHRNKGTKPRALSPGQNISGLWSKRACKSLKGDLGRSAEQIRRQKQSSAVLRTSWDSRCWTSRASKQWSAFHQLKPRHGSSLPMPLCKTHTLLLAVAPGNATGTEDSSALRGSRRHVHGAVRVLSSAPCPCSASHQDVKVRCVREGKDRKTPRDGLTESSPSPQAQGHVWWTHATDGLCNANHAWEEPVGLTGILRAFLCCFGVFSWLLTVGFV